MKFILALFSLPLLTQAQRPTNTSICDFYTSTLLGTNTAASQSLLITLLVNTFVIGNYSTPNVGVPCAGIAAPAVYNGTTITLLPYFTGVYNSTNKGGDSGVSGVLFLDDGGAGPLAKNMSSNGDVGTAQYRLLTHIYQYFGTLLGCSKQGGADFPSYQGRTSLYDVHKFMDFDIYQMSFFISTVQSSALSLGFNVADASSLANTLNTLFNTRCAPPTAVPGINATAELQSICIAANCPLDPHADCGAYPDNGVAKIPVNVSALTGTSGNVTTLPTSKLNGTVAAGQGFVGKEMFSLPLLMAVISSLVFALSAI